MYIQIVRAQDSDRMLQSICDKQTQAHHTISYRLTYQHIGYCTLSFAHYSDMYMYVQYM